MLQNGAEVDSRLDDEVSMPIHMATRYGYISIMKLLIEYGADVLAKGWNGFLPIHYAAYYKHFEAAQFLVENGGNNHSATVGGFTPIDYAVMFGSENIFRLFIKKGAIVRQDSIKMAIENHSVEMIQPLIEYGLDVNYKDDEGKTALECGLSKEKWNICKSLIVESNMK